MKCVRCGGGEAVIGEGSAWGSAGGEWTIEHRVPLVPCPSLRPTANAFRTEGRKWVPQGVYLGSWALGYACGCMVCGGVRTVRVDTRVKFLRDVDCGMSSLRQSAVYSITYENDVVVLYVVSLTSTHYRGSMTYKASPASLLP